MPPLDALLCPHCGKPVPPHPPAGSPPPPEYGVILADIQKVLDQMSKTADALAKLQADDTELAGEIAQLLALVAAFPAQQSAAITAALNAAGTDDDTNAAVVAAADQQTQTLISQIAAVLPAPAPAPATA